MKVLKFGGTSVGSSESLRNVKNIIETRNGEKLIVVVSALGGITDKLIAAARTASKGDLKYIVDYAEIVSRHLSMIDEMVPVDSQPEVKRTVNALLEELGNIFRGISLIKDLSQRTLDVVVSYGERMSSAIIAKVISGARLVDSRDIIITRKNLGKHILDVELTDRNIHHYFDGLDYDVVIAPGFISSDLSGDVTNLGRGGSDFTAAILAGALGAEILEIWTDVDGFMTADHKCGTTGKSHRPIVIQRGYATVQLWCQGYLSSHNLSGIPSQYPYRCQEHFQSFIPGFFDFRSCFFG